MPTIYRKVGTTVVSIWSPNDLQEYCDILIQNLSANTLYLGDQDVSTANGVSIVPTVGNYANDHQAEPVYLIADGADSDVRIRWTVFKERDRTKEVEPKNRR